MKTFQEFLNEDVNFLSKINSDYALGIDKCNSDKTYAIVPNNGRYTVIQLFRGNKTGTTETNADGVKKNFIPVIDPKSWKNKELIKDIL